MSVINNLLPYNKNHSLSEAVLVIYLIDEIKNPERFEDLIFENGAFRELFDDFKLLNTAEVKLNVEEETPRVEYGNRDISGFAFRKFLNGKPEWVINYDKNLPNQAAYISIHCLNYSRWEAFLKQVETYLEIISKFDLSIHIQAYGLNNIDQFNWIGDEFPNVENIFNLKNLYVPAILISSQDVWNYAINHSIKKPNEQEIVEYIEKVEVYVRRIAQGNINIGVIHNTIRESSHTQSLFQLMNEDINSFRDIVYWAHQNNKNILKDLLTQEVQNIIHLQ